MLKCSTSLWSADLANLASEIKRVEPHSDRFHLDVADGIYVPTLLFFPDLVKAMRPHTRLPFEVHLITRQPLKWLDSFVEAGADIVIVYYDIVEDMNTVLDAIHAKGLKAGISLRIEDPLEVLDPYWNKLDVLTIVGTDIGIKGAGMDESVPPKIRQARQLISEHGLPTEIEADGGIRRETVPLIAEAGADLIVPGSLMFNWGPQALTDLIRSLPQQ
ncbi:MAG: ribulose-phosphate 3-epimerase [Anaerolineae bacterium]